MKLRNISEEDFRFEETFIPAGQVSEELDLYVAQRLLAIFFQEPLVPVEESPKEPEISDKEEKPIQDEELAEPADSLSYDCLACEKKFASERILKIHNTRVHKIKS